MEPATRLQRVEDDLPLLVAALPTQLQAGVRELPPDELVEIVLDLGRLPQARLSERAVTLSDAPVAEADLAHVLARVGAMGDDNRAGIERTLHRISAIRNRAGGVVGLTLRVGRAVYGTIDSLRDLVGTGLNILFLGRPGVGKTTKLREVARVLADDLNRRVMIVDTSNEIGGDGDIPHPGIGASRRMQVAFPGRQHAVMIEAVENHMPQVIVIDEIGTEAEALAARTIAERGVQLVATAHGNTLENLVLNPTLSDLVGGVHTVTLSDEEARRRGTQKTITERRAPPTFDIVVEMVSRDEVLVHRETARSVDELLAGRPVPGERRKYQDGQVQVEAEPAAAAPLPATAPPPEERRRLLGEGPVRLHGHGVTRNLLERVMREMGLRGRVVDRPDQADLVLALRTKAHDPRIRRVAEREGVRVEVVKRTSTSELKRVLRRALLIGGGEDRDQLREAIAEVEGAIERVSCEGIAVALAPRPPGLRRVQHQVITRYHLDSASTGSEPMRHLVIFPPNGRPAHVTEQ